MHDPKVTVLMSVYNGECFLREAVESILNQTFTDFEFLIINDGSTDSTTSIFEEYERKDKRIKVVHQENIGLTKSLNKGIKLARGKYIARMDADDISEPKRLEMQVKFLDTHLSIGVVGINSYVIDERGNILGKLERPTCHNEIMAKILSDNKMVHGSLMLRKNLLETCGCYNEEMTLAQDYELLLRLSTVAELANIPHPLYKWRENAYRITATKRKTQIVFRDIIRRNFLEKHYALNKNYINLVLLNFQNNPTDIILFECINKILKDISLMPGIFIKLKVLYYLTKRYFYPSRLHRIIKKKMMELIKGQYTTP